jgi:hypothetical protein
MNSSLTRRHLTHKRGHPASGMIPFFRPRCRDNADVFGQYHPYATVIPNKDPSQSRPKDRQKGISRLLWATDAHTETEPLSVAMETHTDGLEPERLVSFSRRPKEWRPLIAAEAKWPCRRSYAWIRGQWCSPIQAQAESGLSAQKCCRE